MFTEMFDACLQFEQFLDLISHMVAAKRSVINCSELVFNIIEVVLYMFWLKNVVLTVTEQTDHIV